MRRNSLIVGLSLSILLSATSAEAAPRWKRKLRKLTRPSSLSILVRDGKSTLFDRRSSWRRIPASNQKLLLSMALLDTLGPQFTFPTKAWAEPSRPPLVEAGEPDVRDGVLRSNLWVTGSGDPTISKAGGGYGGHLSVEPTWIGGLARAIKQSGIRKINGRVIGVRSRFRHDWDAPGWKANFNERYVALPSALTIDGNIRKGRFIHNPEVRLAQVLTKTLEKKGVEVRRGPRAWKKRPKGLAWVAAVRSRPLAALLGHMNRVSSNFFAEVFGKALAVGAGRRPGTIALGAEALEGWMAARRVSVRAHDGSGLSYANRVSPKGIVRLLGKAEGAGWGKALFRSLPKGGWGTLRNRLHDVRIRAKTGTLDGVSSLSGWLWLRRSQTWARFSIVSNGRSTWKAKSVEDRVVHLLSRHL